MAAEITSGFVIKIINYQDTDLIITLLTPYELISFIALGVRKITSKNRVSLQLGNLIEVEIFRARLLNKLSKLKKAHIIKQPVLQESDNALVWLEIIKLLQKMESYSTRVFQTLVEVYNYFGNDYNHHIKSYVAFSILDALGSYPITNCCVECNRKDQITSFDIQSGGFLCNLHAKYKNDLKELKAFQALSLSFKDYLQVDPKTNKVIFKKISNFINSYTY